MSNSTVTDRPSGTIAKPTRFSERLTGHLADFRGSVRLLADATVGVTTVVESMHATIVRRAPIIGAPPASNAPGLAGSIYKVIRSVAGEVGMGVDSILKPFEHFSDMTESAGHAADSRSREAMVAALNGVLGDHLERSGNPLAIPMSFRHRGVSLSLDRATLAAAFPTASTQLLIVIHGLCMNDLQCCRHGHDHGAQLAEALGFTPVYLHYNTGRHIADNGDELAGLMEQLVDAWPVAVDKIHIVAHSMGGLVARAACFRAEQQAFSWRRHLRTMIFLGTPHHGTPFERWGNRLQNGLGVSPYVAPLADMGRLRSAGITDLRHGNLGGPDHRHGDRFLEGLTPPHVPLPDNVECYAIAASSKEDGVAGDGLVPVASALGEHFDPQRRLNFDESHRWVGGSMNHWDLLDHAEVYEKLQAWLGMARQDTIMTEQE